MAKRYTLACVLRGSLKLPEAMDASKTWSNFHMNFQWKMDMINGDMYYTYGDEGQWYFGSYTAVNPYINTKPSMQPWCIQAARG